jgi:hypothetical protein
MRPVSIRWFDRLFLTALALVVPLNALETWQTFNLGNSAYLLSSFVLPIIIRYLLWFFISRRASNVAKWLWVFLLGSEVIALPLLSIMVGGDFIESFLLHGVLGAAVDIIRILLDIVAAIMLFRPDAAKWLASRGKIVDVSVFS